jgi:hypothetical protein
MQHALVDVRILRADAKELVATAELVHLNAGMSTAWRMRSVCRALHYIGQSTFWTSANPGVVYLGPRTQTCQASRVSMVCVKYPLNEAPAWLLTPDRAGR